MVVGDLRGVTNITKTINRHVRGKIYMRYYFQYNAVSHG